MEGGGAEADGTWDSDGLGFHDSEGDDVGAADEAHSPLPGSSADALRSAPRYVAPRQGRGKARGAGSLAPAQPASSASQAGRRFRDLAGGLLNGCVRFGRAGSAGNVWGAHVVVQWHGHPSHDEMMDGVQLAGAGSLSDGIVAMKPAFRRGRAPAAPVQVPSQPTEHGADPPHTRARMAMRPPVAGCPTRARRAIERAHCFGAAGSSVNTEHTHCSRRNLRDETLLFASKKRMGSRGATWAAISQAQVCFDAGSNAGYFLDRSGELAAPRTQHSDGRTLPNLTTAQSTLSCTF